MSKTNGPCCRFQILTAGFRIAGTGRTRQARKAALEEGPERASVRAYHSSGQGSTIFQRSTPFLIFFISVVRPPLRRIQSFTVSG